MLVPKKYIYDSLWRFPIENIPWAQVTSLGSGSRAQELVLEAALGIGGPFVPIPFRYKPGPLGRAPPWVAPHQPRLDWQMW